MEERISLRRKGVRCTHAGVGDERLIKLSGMPPGEEARRVASSGVMRRRRVGVGRRLAQRGNVAGGGPLHGADDPVVPGAPA